MCAQVEILPLGLDGKRIRADPGWVRWCSPSLNGSRLGSELAGVCLRDPAEPNYARSVGNRMQQRAALPSGAIMRGPSNPMSGRS